jgi:hypothetical protein
VFRWEIRPLNITKRNGNSKLNNIKSSVHSNQSLLNLSTLMDRMVSQWEEKYALWMEVF